jgi:hypothetical protein
VAAPSGAKQAAEKLVPGAVLKGREFTRADKSIGLTPASAAEGCISQSFSELWTFSAASNDRHCPVAGKESGSEIDARSSASTTDVVALAGVPVDAAAASRSAMGVARGLWMGAKITRSKIGKRI